MKTKTLIIVAALLISGTAAYAQSADMSNSASNSKSQTNANASDSMGTTGTTASTKRKYHQTDTGANTNDGMAEKQHAGSPSDSPRSGTQSGMSNQTMNPAVNSDKLTP